MVAGAGLVERNFCESKNSSTYKILRFKSSSNLILFSKKKRSNGPLFSKWLRELDLNQRPSGYEPDELPDCSIPRYLIVICDYSLRSSLVPRLTSPRTWHLVTSSSAEYPAINFLSTNIYYYVRSKKKINPMKNILTFVTNFIFSEIL